MPPETPTRVIGDSNRYAQDNTLFWLFLQRGFTFLRHSICSVLFMAVIHHRGCAKSASSYRIRGAGLGCLHFAADTEAYATYKMIEELQVRLCHPFSIDLMRTRETLLTILMELQDWKEALGYCRSTIPVYQRAYPGFHPSLGLQYYTCGKLEWLLGDTENAIKSLSKVVDILQITHGMNTPFMKELSIKLEEARAEASYKLSSNSLS